jgi:hypothetical protein
VVVSATATNMPNFLLKTRRYCLLFMVYFLKM